MDPRKWIFECENSTKWHRKYILNKWRTGQFPEPYRNWIREYGHLVYIQGILRSNTLMTLDPTIIKRMMFKLPRQYRRTTMGRNMMKMSVGETGILVTDDKKHTHQRKMIVPHFTSMKMQSYFSIFQTHAMKLVSRLDDNTDITTEVSSVALDIIGICAFGYSFSIKENQRVSQAYVATFQKFDLLSVILLNYVPFGLGQYFPTKRFKQTLRSRELVCSTVSNIIEERRRRPEQDETMDLLNVLLKSSDENGNPLTTIEIRDQILTFLLAGHETSASTMAWFFYLMCENQEKQDKIRAEIRAKIPKLQNMTFETIQDLPLLTAAIKETLRLYPTIPLVARELDGSDELEYQNKSFQIKAGQRVMIPIAGMHRCEEYYDRPDDFVPERFVQGTMEFDKDAELKKDTPLMFTYMPFGRGARSCIGDRFAMNEMITILATLMHGFKMELACDSDCKPLMTGIFLKPSGLKVKLIDLR